MYVGYVRHAHYLHNIIYQSDEPYMERQKTINTAAIATSKTKPQTFTAMMMLRLCEVVVGTIAVEEGILTGVGLPVTGYAGGALCLLSSPVIRSPFRHSM